MVEKFRIIKNADEIKLKTIVQNRDWESIIIIV